MSSRIDPHGKARHDDEAGFRQLEGKTLGGLNAGSCCSPGSHDRDVSLRAIERPSARRGAGAMAKHRHPVRPSVGAIPGRNVRSRGSCCNLIVGGKQTKAERAQEMGTPDDIAAFEVGHRPRHSQQAIYTTTRQRERIDRCAQVRSRGVIEIELGVELTSGGRRVVVTDDP